LYVCVCATCVRLITHSVGGFKATMVHVMNAAVLDIKWLKRPQSNTHTHHSGGTHLTVNKYDYTTVIYYSLYKKQNNLIEKLSF